ncbi:hypothetical protein [Oscillibacter sp. CU971]|uniref:hypothetical protein n=1 Tax=Oscillibacter sp. CU971 TaxID=2780102 RepID=UPI00195AC12D|nr:hypothetical protein [Oscillibacter sp. CU971]
MAKNVFITDRPGALDIIVADCKMTEVLSYKLECSNGQRALTPVTDIIGAVTTEIEAPNICLMEGRGIFTPLH